MGTKFLFYWSANSLLITVVLMRIVIVCLAAWLGLTLIATQTLEWIRGGSIVPTWVRSAGPQRI